MAVVPYLSVPDARAAISWYTIALGASSTGTPIMAPDGIHIGRATLSLGETIFYVADAHLAISHLASATHGNCLVHAPCDVDHVIERAIAAEAQLELRPAATDDGRMAVFRDPFGHRWILCDQE